MRRKRCVRRRINEFFYEHCKLDQRIYRIKKSLYELMGILDGIDAKKKKKREEDEDFIFLKNNKQRKM